MNSQNGIVMEELTDSGELAESQARRKQFDRNADWLHAHAAEVYPKHRGKCICVAGEEVFAADTAKAALAKAQAAHPLDQGRFVHYIPKEKVCRVYAN